MYNPALFVAFTVHHPASQPNNPLPTLEMFAKLLLVLFAACVVEEILAQTRFVTLALQHQVLS